MPESQEPTLGDLVIEDLERQLGEGDPRYGRKCRDLALVRAEYNQLMNFVRSRADVLGLVEVGPDGNPTTVPPKDEDEKSAPAPVVNGKGVARETVKKT